MRDASARDDAGKLFQQRQHVAPITAGQHEDSARAVGPPQGGDILDDERGRIGAPDGVTVFGVVQRVPCLARVIGLLMLSGHGRSLCIVCRCHVEQ